MTIAAHIESSRGQVSYLGEHICRIATKNPDIRFIVFCAKEMQQAVSFPSNCTILVINPAIKNSLLLHYWYNYKLPRLLAKYNVSVFVSENAVCSLRTEIRQVMLVNDLFLQPPGFPLKKAYRSYLNRYFYRFAEKAAAVCVAKAFIADDLIKKYSILAEKTSVILHGIDKDFKPISPTEKEKLQEKYTDGYGYFVCECSALTQNNLLAVLKAFSIFKKRLKSGMQLLILNRLPHLPVEDFGNYKYRQEVKVISNISIQEEALIVAAAYAGIYPPSFFTSENWGLCCMKSGIPLLTIENKNSESTYHDAAIYTSSNEKNIAEFLMLLYKDETYRNVYIKRGADLASLYNWEESSSKLWELF